MREDYGIRTKVGYNGRKPFLINSHAKSSIKISGIPLALHHLNIQNPGDFTETPFVIRENEVNGAEIIISGNTFLM